MAIIVLLAYIVPFWIVPKIIREPTSKLLERAAYKNIKRGYRKSTITKSLKGRGWDKRQVDAAVKRAWKKHKK